LPKQKSLYTPVRFSKACFLFILMMILLLHANARLRRIPRATRQTLADGGVRGSLRIKQERCMRSLAALLVCLAGAHSLHVLHERSTPCSQPYWDTGQTRLYNVAFEMADRRALQDWKYVPAKYATPAAKSCVNVSYASAFNNSNLFLYADLKRISVRKTVCVSGRALHEHTLISNIPLLQEAVAGVSVSAQDGQELRVTATFETATPWVLTLVESAVADYVRSYLVKYVNLLTQTACAG
jgi:hypothetical protein